MRIAFAGTPDFAAEALKALIAAGHTITLVLTQPDRPSGRGMKLKPSPVKAVALEHGLVVLTPLALRGPKAGDEGEAALKALEESESDVFVVAAYGLILPERALNAARGVGEDGSIKSINIHASLLPRWRGAAPINRAIEAMDKETGVDLMKMDIGLDTGDVICSAPVSITEDHDAARLTEELTQVGARLIVTALEHPETLTHSPQLENGVTYAKKLLKTESPIVWTQDARQVAARIRAFSPFPGSTAVRNGETVKIWFAKAVEGSGQPVKFSLWATRSSLPAVRVPSPAHGCSAPENPRWTRNPSLKVCSSKLVRYWYERQRRPTAAVFETRRPRPGID